MQRSVLFILLTALISCTEPKAHPPTKPDLPPIVSNPNPSPSSTPTPAPNLPIVDSDTSKVPQIGEDGSFEFGTWNIENFPKTGRAPTMASEVLKKFNVDLMALEEVASETSFQEVLDAMPGFSGVLSPHHYDNNEYQKLAFIYRNADVELLDWQLLFTEQTYEFPRPPLQAHFRIKTGTRANQEFYFIAVHLKATDQDKSQERREIANRMLESYVAELAKREPGVQVTLLGDFNEKVTYPAGLNVFKPWLDKPDAYTFQTAAMAQAGEYSFISSSKPMLDHMISTRNVELKPITIPKLENMIEGYRDLLSDHLPVLARVR